MTKLTFEVAAFADVVKKAASTAPSSGMALDTTPGILISYDRGIDFEDVTVRATNLELFYTEWVTPLGIEGEPVKWLVSSNLLAAVAGSLPIGSNKTVSISDAGSFLMLESGSVRCKLPLLSQVKDYPDWGVFDPTLVSGTNNFADQIAKVAWACASGATVPTNGVHFDGDYAVATDRFKLVITPCKIDTERPFTIPSTSLVQLIKSNGGEDAKVTFYDGKLLVMPIPSVQIQVIAYQIEYISWAKVTRRDQPASFKVGKSTLAELVQRVSSLIQKDRQPKIDVLIGRETLVMTSADPSDSKLQDVLALPGYASHERVLYAFNPANLLAAIQNAPGSEVTVHYWPELEPGKFASWRIVGGEGYEAWVMSRMTGKKDTG